MMMKMRKISQCAARVLALTEYCTLFLTEKCNSGPWSQCSSAELFKELDHPWARRKRMRE